MPSIALRWTAAAALAAAASGCGAQNPPPQPVGGPITRYVAMGDSFTAAPGILPIDDAGCLRSGANYASLVATRLDVEDFADVSCSGADTGDLRSPQERNGAEVNPAQFDGLTEDTDLVTLGIGLNDGGLSAQTLYLCLPTVGNPAACQAFLNIPDQRIADRVAKIGDSVKAAVESIRARAPRARIVLVGYPQTVPDTGCAAELPLSEAALDRVRFVLTAADEVFAAVAAAEEIEYADMYQASAGHELCSKRPWVNGVEDAGADGAALHPRPLYQQAVADEVLRLVGE